MQPKIPSTLSMELSSRFIALLPIRVVVAAYHPSLDRNFGIIYTDFLVWLVFEIAALEF